MARPLRLEYPGAVWHVTSRGNERRSIFRSDRDRERFLSILGRTVDRFGWKLHAYVLMGNHYHLLVETPVPTLSRGMRQLNGVYTQFFNRQQRRAGHLFQGRFKAILLEKDAHLLELCRYVVLNPVRARLVRTPADWSWSSYAATLGKTKAPPWLETDWTLEKFGGSRRNAERAYRHFVAEGVRSGARPWDAVHGGIYLGGQGFLSEVRTRLKSVRRPTGVPRRHLEPGTLDVERTAPVVAKALGSTLETMRAKPRTSVVNRGLLAWSLQKFALARLAEISRVLGVGIAQASVLARRGEVEAKTHPETARRLEDALAKYKIET